ncbi:A-kinase anchor protein 1, mitochondrial [Toxorhynchites rutilus septentrionalis]|uniref:A-kinase anchor protein 1, mitochondrial n=1 Tax=Toxorhynchites rutilus septentrionalis TaxID=329112 RepID=UPI0024783FEF|nr:A-kinase anchor protein 1, mitochondrial [Toxorhynchites rutilus septentrionalis]
MVNGRPLLYLSLPSLAVIIGLVWFRRRKCIDFDSGGSNSVDENVSAKKSTTTSCAANDSNVKQTESLPITPSANVKDDSGKNQSSSSSSSCSGKSAPIDIVPNTRSPPKYSDKQLDAELLKLKIEESDIRTLRLIEEQDDFSSFESPVNLPGTVDRYSSNFNRFNKSFESHVEPVVVVASSAAKISPKNSFATELSPPVHNENSLSESKIHSSVVEETITQVKCINNNQQEEIEKNKTEMVACATEEDSINNNTTSEISVTVNGNETSEHCPAGSPPLSICSMRSGDSGKGSSPPQSECAPITRYEFLLPVYLVSKMLGAKGSFVQLIKNKTGTNVLIRRNLDTHKTKLCSLEGTQADIDNALHLIRKRFPERRFPALTLEQISVKQADEVVPLPLIDSTYISLQLVESINNDVIISSIVNGGHVFVQQPLHPSFQSIEAMQENLNTIYNLEEAPLLPSIFENAICVSAVHRSWYRVQIVSHNAADQNCLVKYLDYGGYAHVPVSSLRQIRTDCMGIPFQAVECVLSNIKHSGDSQWSPEATEVLYSLTKRSVLQAQVAGYTAEGLPEIFLFAALAKGNVLFINKELVARGLAEWVE